MTAQVNSLEKTILSALQKYSPSVDHVGRRRWDFTIANGRANAFSAQIEDEWVVLQSQIDSAPTDAAASCWWKLLCLNAQLGGNAKVALQSDSWSIVLRAEIPVDEDVDLKRRLHEACRGLQTAVACLHAERKEASPASTKEPHAVANADGMVSPGFDLRALCEQTGWPLNQREDGSVAFDLQARTGFQQALVRSDPQERVSVSTDLAECSVLPIVSRQAISHMLLHASRLVRGARAVGHVRDNSAVIRFETVFSSRPTARELEHALAALAVANDLCGVETLALQDEGIAEGYLRLQGWTGKSSGSLSASMINEHEENEASFVAA